MNPARILVVEDDPGVLHSLKTVLTQKGYEVFTGTDGLEGINVARARLPDLMILDVMMPNMDGWTMLRALRALPEFAMVPAIFLTALPVQDNVVDSFRMGGVDYIPKPFRFDDVLTKVAAALRRRDAIEQVFRVRAQFAQPPGPSPALRVQLDQVGLASLMSVLEMEKKTGVLTLTRGQFTGLISIREGRVVRAEIRGLPGVVHAAAVYHLLGWEQGQAEFGPQAVDGPDEVNSSTTHLLMEGARIIDEQRHRAAGGGGGES